MSEIEQTTTAPPAGLVAAERALHRNLTVIALHPDEKRPQKWWTERHFGFDDKGDWNLETGLYDVRMHWKMHPRDRAGIYLVHGLGNVFVVDIDRAVIEKRLREEDRELPLTYTVQSRPKTAEHKKHLYFTQTEHSLIVFGDTNRFAEDYQGEWDENKGKYGGFSRAFDIKGCGSHAQVVAEGNWREDTQEAYTAMDESAPIIPIPDWFVDWLMADVVKSRSEVQKTSHRQRELKTKQQRAGVVPIADWRALVNSRVPSLAAQGVEREDIVMLVMKEIRKRCGKAVAASEKVKNRVRGKAFSRKLIIGACPIKNAYTTKENASGYGYTFVPVLSRQSRLSEMVEKFPKEISREDVKVLFVRHFGKKAKPATIRGVMSRTMKSEGFSYDPVTEMYRRGL